jgi:hypothetical protein
MSDRLPIDLGPWLPRLQREVEWFFRRCRGRVPRSVLINEGFVALVAAARIYDRARGGDFWQLARRRLRHTFDRCRAAATRDPGRERRTRDAT